MGAVMRINLPCLIAIIAATVGANVALAHHSISQFDVERTVTLHAIVKEFDWANPHVYIALEALDEAGVPTVWMIEGGPPNLMARAGWSARSLIIGESVTAAIHPVRNGNQRIALGNSITKDDGTTLPIRGAALPSELSTPDRSTLIDSDDIFSRWTPVWDAQQARAFLAPEGAWPLTEAGISAIESYVLSDNPAKDCNLEKPPFSMIWPSVIDIESDGDIVRLSFELLPDRIIHMDGQSHEGAEIAPNGHSIGYFEGTTLVVDTTNFETHRRGLGRGLPSSPEKHLIERFELGPTGTEISYQFWVEDPVYLQEPIAGRMQLQHRPDLIPERVACDRVIASRYLEYE